MTELIDPQLAAFEASDPSLLQAPVSAPERDKHRRELELAIAAAALIMIKVVRDRLAAEHQGVDTAHGAVGREWKHQMPLWMRLVVPAVLRAYERDHVGAGLTQHELESVATSYAESLGQYVGDSSADALQAGLQEQLNNQWDDRLSWQRVVGGFGLDARDMRGYIRQLITGIVTAPTELISPVARIFADRATLARVDRIGQSESWTAVETGRALAWMFQQRAGQLPADAMREWDTAEDESTCAVCAPMDGGLAALDERFTLPGGAKLWAPQAHPGCRCRVRLVVPEAPIGKAWSPEESREHPTGAGHRFVRKPARVAPVVEREAVTVDPIVEAALRGVADDVEDVVLAPIPTLTALPTLQAQPTLIPTLQPQQLGPTLTPTLSPLGLPAGGSAADVREEWKRRRTVKNNLLLVIPPAKKARPRGDVYYVDTDRYNRVTRRELGEWYNPYEEVDFSRVQQLDGFSADSAMKQPNWAVQKADLLTRHGIPPEKHEDIENVLDMEWTKIVDKALPLVDTALGRDPDTGEVNLSRPRSYMRNLSNSQLHDIAINAGFIRPGDMVDQATIERAILADIAKVPKGEDTGLAQAYVDHVVWQDTVLLGDQQSRGLVDAMEDAREYGIKVGAAPVSQVFSFDTNNARQGDTRPGAIVPHGDYKVFQVRYHSGLMGLKEDLKFLPLHIGTQELQMVPLGVSGGTWKPRE